MKKNVAAMAGAVRDMKDQLAARVGDLGGAGAESMKSLVEDVNQLMPAIKQAGYHVGAVDVEAAVPPKIVIHCRMEIDVPADERVKLVESLAGSRLSTLAVRLLFQVSDVQRNLRLGTLKPTEVLLELGLSPAVKLHYREPGATTA